MTNLQYISTKIGGNYPIDSDVFLNALQSEGIDPDGEYIAGRGFDMAFISVLQSLIASANRISEGGYAIQVDIDAIRSLLNWYLNKWGLSAPNQPIIRGRRATSLW